MTRYWFTYNHYDDLTWEADGVRYEYMYQVVNDVSLYCCASVHGYATVRMLNWIFI